MTSPGRPSPLTRPHWPWSAYTHRSSHSSLSTHSVGGSIAGSQSSLDFRTPSSPATVILTTSTPLRQHTGQASMFPSSVQHQDTIRNWSFAAFEWVVRDVERLTRVIESETEIGDDQDETGSRDEDQDFEILKQSPLLGDGKFKLEIARTATVNGPPTLSLYITSLVVDFSQNDYEMSATMMAAIKSQDDKTGERGARAEWVWEVWQNDWTFRQESEVWECPLPPLSTLLENPRIKETDSFVICVQIHSPVGPFYPQQPSAFYVPRDLLDGLEASLDNPNTGDVQFICLERMEQTAALSPALLPSRSPSTASSSAHDSLSFLTPQTAARKRIIYAHSDILTRRSEYFSTMLASSFSENNSQGQWVSRGSERKTYTIVVEEADFVTIYWLLKWVYANWLLFKEHDDPRVAVEGIGAGWSAKWLQANGTREWDWKRFDKKPVVDDPSGSRSDVRSITSCESARSGDAKGKGKPHGPSGTLQATTPTSSARTRATTAAITTSSPTKVSPRQPTTSVSRRSNPSHVQQKMPSVVTMPVPVPISLSSATHAPSSSAPAYPLSPRTAGTRQHPAPDPHPHPTPSPPPASALSMYQIAHRYFIPGLATLALEHIMTTITPRSSFALLLASSMWDELRGLIEDYVVEKWDEVSLTTEFERCCEEVAAGEWGPEGGKTLMGLFRRLRSPNVMPFTRA